LIIDVPIREAAQRLGRTEQSVNMRRWRLRSGQIVNVKGD
jgi:hypothetical protein